MVSRLWIKLGDEIGPPGGKLSTSASLFRSAPCSAGNVDEHNRQAMSPECVGQCAGVLHYPVSRARGGESEDALLQIDDKKSGPQIKRSYCHGVLSLVIWTVACPE